MNPLKGKNNAGTFCESELYTYSSGWYWKGSDEIEGRWWSVIIGLACRRIPRGRKYLLMTACQSEHVGWRNNRVLRTWPYEEVYDRISSTIS